MHSIESVLSTLGVLLKGNSRQKWCVCPLPQHRHVNFTPSFSVFWHTINGEWRQYWKCHGSCSTHGDVIDLAGYLWVPAYSREGARSDQKMREMARQALGSTSLPYEPAKPSKASPNLPQWIWKDFLPIGEEALRYAYQRGLDDRLLIKYRIGSAETITESGKVIKGRDNLMSFPNFHGDTLMGIKLRKLVSGKYRYFSYPGSKKGLYGYDDVNLHDGPVLVVKGEIAKLIGEKFGFTTCAPTSGENGNVDEIRGALAFSKNIVVGDNDDTGRRQAHKRALIFRALEKYPPEPYDFDRWLLEDPQAAGEVKRWISEIKTY
jgi:hypothetical protein